MQVSVHSFFKLHVLVEVAEMFWDGWDFESVYRIRVVSLFMLLILLVGSFGTVAYWGLLQPLVFPLGSYFYLLPLRVRFTPYTVLQIKSRF